MFLSPTTFLLLNFNLQLNSPSLPVTNIPETCPPIRIANASKKVAGDEFNNYSVILSLIT
jgi:hypothetical protein